MEVQRERISSFGFSKACGFRRHLPQGPLGHCREGGRGKPETCRWCWGPGSQPFTPLARRPRADACVPHSGDSGKCRSSRKCLMRWFMK